MAVNSKDDDVNSLEGSDDFGLANLGRLEQQYANEPAVVRLMKHKVQQARTLVGVVNQVATKHPEAMLDPKEPWAKMLAENQSTLHKLTPRMELHGAAATDRFNQQATNMIGREYSERAINSRVNSSRHSLETQVAGQAMTSQGYSALANSRDTIMNQMQGLRHESMEAARSYMTPQGVNPDSANTLQFNSYLMKDMAQKLVPITAAMSQLKDQGLDPQSRQRALINTGDKAAGLLSYNKLENEMASGKGLGSFSAGDLRKKEAEAAEGLIKALEELRAGAGKTAKELEGLNENAEAAAKNFEDISEARKISPPGGGGYKTGAAYAGVVEQLASLIGNTIQTMAIDQPMAQMANIGGYANIENQKFDSWRAGNEGNMTERLNQAGYGNAAQFGRSMAGGAGAVVIARGIGGIATAVGGGLQFADALTSAPQTVAAGKTGFHDANTVQQVAGGALVAGQGIANIAIAANDGLKKISTSQAEIAGNQNAINVTRALTHVAGYQLQQYRDYMMDLNQGAKGLGDQGGNFIDQAGGSAFIDRMSSVGLGRREAGGLATVGSVNMGSTFSADQLIRAKHYENQGWGSSQEQMQRMAGFAAAGSQNPMQSMERVLERAVGSGINSSKALGIIAENTGQLVEADNMRGSSFDTTDAIARAILGATDKTNTNKEFAVKQAAENFKNQESVKTDTTASFANMSAVSRLQKDLDLDYNSARMMKGTSTGMWNTWRDLTKAGKTDQVTREMRAQGIDIDSSSVFKKDPNAFWDAFGQNRALMQVEQLGHGYSNGATKNFSKLVDWMGHDQEKINIVSGQSTDKNAPEWVKKELTALGQNYKSLNPNASPLAGRKDFLVELGLLKAGFKAVPNEGGKLTDIQQEAAVGDQANNENMKAGMGVLGVGGGGGKAGAAALAVTARAHKEAYGKDAANQWTDAAARSAHDFGASAMKLDSASGKLVEAATKLIEFAGANRSDAPDTSVDKAKREIESKVKPIQTTLEKYFKDEPKTKIWPPWGK